MIDNHGAPDASLTVREATIDLLRHLGITKIFGNPGSTELPLFRDFPADFEYVLGLQEAVVVGMADGYAQAVRNAAFVNLHAAAGLGNGLGNIYTAYKNQTPLLVTAGQQARSILQFDPYLFAERATEFARPYVKYSIEPARAEDVPLAIAQAYRIAMQPPRGPVFISVPVDDWDRPGELVPAREVTTAVRGDPVALARVAEALARARRPAFVVGPGVARDEAWSEVVALAERHQAAVWATPQASLGAFPENHALFAGSLRAGREEIVAALEPYDVVVVLGAPVFLYHVEGSGPHLPEHARLFQLTDNPSLASSAAVGESIITNLKLGLCDLLAGPLPIARERGVVALKRAEPAARMTDSYVYSRMARLRPKGSILVEEAPGSRLAMRDHCPVIEPDSFYAGASGGLGFGLPAAIGIAKGYPDRKILAVIGDGSAMYAIPALWNAAQDNLPISFIILNNRKYAALVKFGNLFRLERTLGTDLPSLDFVDIATGHGVEARKVESVGLLDEALEWSLSAAYPTLLDLVIECS